MGLIPPKLQAVVAQYGMAGVATYLGLSFSCVGVTFYSITHGTNMDQLVASVPLPTAVKGQRSLFTTA